MDESFVRSTDINDEQEAERHMRRRLLIAETVTRIEKEVTSLQRNVEHLADAKQNRIGLGIILPLILYLFTQIVVGVWWASEVTQGIARLDEKVETASKDRFYGKDGEALRQLIQYRHEAQTSQIENLKLTIREQDARNDAYHARVNKDLEELEAIFHELEAQVNLNSRLLDGLKSSGMSGMPGRTYNE